MNIKNSQKGQLIISVIGILLFLMVIIPALIFWVNNQAKWSVKQQKTTTAFNLAEAAIDRGVWKLKSSTGTWDQASKGIVITGYNFDVVYKDIPNGEYRIKFSSGPNPKEVTIYGEGKDLTSQEIRAIKAVYRNQVIPGAMISRGIITWANAFSAHWGPIMSHNNINITDANAAKDYFPRKFSRQVVQCTIGSYPRDQNGLNPPNTDNTEWWSDYPVPDLPVLDFVALRSSAAINMATYLEYDSQDSYYKYYLWKKCYPLGSTPPADWISSATINTLNVIGCSQMSNYTGPKWWLRYNKRKTTGAITTTTLSSCNLGGSSHDGMNHFQNSARHPAAKAGRIWYWDGDVVFTGSVGADGGAIIGSIIVRGNLTNYWGDNLKWYDIGLENCKVPSEAWKEYTIINKSGNNTYYDTTAKNEYPADDGLKKNRSTFKFGEETWTRGTNPPSAENTDIGLKGFLYVGGNFQMERAMDYYGAVWVVGDVARATGLAEQSIIFFDENLDLPSLNVVLVRKSWDEIQPSSTSW